MTEQEWLACTDPQPMLQFLRGKASDRKLRLFAASCCRQIWHLLPDTRSRTAVEMTELAADLDGLELEKSRQAADEAVWASQGVATRKAARVVADITVEWRVTRALGQWIALSDSRERTEANLRSFLAATLATSQAAALAAPEGMADNVLRAERKAQVSLIHDLFGNPFRPMALDPAWRTPNVTTVAQTIYAERRFGDLPVLADALEEAGCASAELLAHLRSGGEHVRGCWALDLALGKG